VLFRSAGVHWHRNRVTELKLGISHYNIPHNNCLSAKASCWSGFIRAEISRSRKTLFEVSRNRPRLRGNNANLVINTSKFKQEQVMIRRSDFEGDIRGIYSPPWQSGSCSQIGVTCNGLIIVIDTALNEPSFHFLFFCHCSLISDTSQSSLFSLAWTRALP
jgi:hypothetical protein